MCFRPGDSDGMATDEMLLLHSPSPSSHLLTSLLLHEPHFTVVRELFESKVGQGCIQAPCRPPACLHSSRT